ncbi:MAG: 4Fe-4S dicluster domain-containing protein [Bacillota bacterium]
MRLFDTKVQHLKYKVLREVAKASLNDTLIHAYRDIPQNIIKGPNPNYRCCIYKERAIISERITLAMGGNQSIDSPIEVINIACDECPVGGYEVTRACRGCIAHRCKTVCPKEAISFDHNHRAVIDKDKCVECGQCEKVCPYSAIVHYKRPCVNACPVEAITMNNDNTATIDYDRCIECGACVHQCPFGAISDKSEILDVVETLKDNALHKKKIYAIVAPSISSQFSYASLNQVITGIKMMGFHDVVEAALGADLAALLESKELSEKGFLTSSCCPSFVTYIEKHIKSMTPHISHNLSPMALVGAHIKKHTPNAYTVFIGPCTSKKSEAKKDTVKGSIDAVLTFEELQALIDAYDINLSTLKAEDTLNNASYYGRIFARTGGLSDAMRQAFKEQAIDFDFNPIVCSGIKESKTALLKASHNKLQANFIEGMACEGGCIGGPCCLTHGPKDLKQVDRYGKEAYEKTIKDAVLPFEL